MSTNRIDFSPAPIILTETVDKKRIEQLIDQIFRTDGRVIARQVIDCTRVTEFTGVALSMMALLIKQARIAGGDLVLLNLSPKILGSVSDVLIDEMVPQFLTEMVRNLVKDSREIALGKQRQHNVFLN